MTLKRFRAILLVEYWKIEASYFRIIRSLKHAIEKLFCKHQWRKIFDNSSVEDENWYKHGRYVCKKCAKSIKF